MWSERPNITQDMFNTYKDAIECQFHPSMWFERPDII